VPSGERCGWENAKFANCRVPDGSANNTVQVLQGFGFEVIVCNLFSLARHNSLFRSFVAIGG
jgi:hypothetical protein